VRSWTEDRERRQLHPGPARGRRALGAHPRKGPGRDRCAALRHLRSYLHARHHCDALADVAAEIGYDGAMRSHHEVIFGHEFCGMVAEHGLGCRRSAATGTHVVAFPLLRRGRDVHPIGLSAAAPGGYAEQVIVEEPLTVAVPNGLAPDTAALTEPMAVAWHAVRRDEVKKGTVAIVIGCGPVGLGVICMLKASGVRHVIAGDLSPGRRALAERCGADLVVDPMLDSPYAGCADRGRLVTAPAALEPAVGVMEKLRRLPVPWEPLQRKGHCGRLGRTASGVPRCCSPG